MTDSPDPVAPAANDYEALMEELDGLGENLRTALQACFGEVLPPQVGARETGRLLGLRRNLGWKVFAVANSISIASLLRAMPGDSGWALLFEALDRLGCHPDRLAMLREAIAGLQRVLSGGVVDPACLRALGAGSLESAAQRRAMLRSRRMAFTAAKQIFAVHAKARIGTVIAAPSATPGEPMVDLLQLTLLEGLERFRAGPAFPIYHRVQAIREQAADGLGADDLDGGEHGPLVASLCSEGAIGHELRMPPPVAPDDRASVEFVDRDPHRVRPLRAAFAEIARRVGSPYASPAEPFAELQMPTVFPVEIALFDVFIHRTLPTGSEPSISLYGHPANVGRPTRWKEQQRLPLEVELAEKTSPRLPRRLSEPRETYQALLEHGMRQIGLPLSEFRHYRAIVPFPPMHSSLIVAWRLAAR